ncbi:MAG: hypothetical protein APF78_03655 [Sphingomonadales bacterium BRH_c3]|nr:MAG: hypothetical protein APF78_03655 [Sphingomonadales bacterium BRH_c3]
MQNDSRMGAAPLLALLIVGSGVAFAQEAEAQEAEAQEADPEALAALPTNERARTNEDASGEIIVTAQRRDQDLIDIPISVSVLDDRAIKAAGLTTFRDLPAIAVGTNIAAVGGYVQPTIRGITTTVIGIGQENNVATYVDGFYQPNPLALNRSLQNIDGIQILKGPQGTLFGRNATGGAILITTANPSFDRSGSIGISYGRYNEIIGDLYYTQGIDDRVALNISGSLKRNDGYIKDIGGFDTAPVRNLHLSSKLLYEPTANLSFILNGRFDKVSNGTGFAVTGTDHLLAKALFPGTQIVEDEFNKTSLTGEQVSKSEVRGVTLTGEWKLSPDVNLTSYSRYDKTKDLINFDQDYSPIQFVDLLLIQRQRNISQEFNLELSLGDLEGILGASYFDSRSLRPLFSAQVSPDPNVPRVNQSSLIKNQALGVYADVTYKLDGAWSLTAGLRYSWEEKDYHFESPPSTTIIDSEVASWSSFTPRLAITYSIDEKTNLYATWSRGFKSGTFNSAVPSRTPIDPEKVDAYEVGLKGRESRISYSAAAFYYDYTDLQVSVTVTENGVALTRISNAASVEIYGAESELVFSPVDRLNLRLGLAYTHARYAEFAGAPVFLPNPATGFNQAAVQDWSGRRALRAPDWTGNLLVDYVIPTSVGSLNLSGNLNFFSRYAPTTALFDPLTGKGSFEQPANARLNLNADWMLYANFTVGLFVRNVTNAKVLLRTEASGFGDFEVYEEPRTFGVTLRTEF